MDTFWDVVGGLAFLFVVFIVIPVILRTAWTHVKAFLFIRRSARLHETTRPLSTKAVRSARLF